MTHLGIDISAEIETNVMRELGGLPPAARNVVEHAHAALCSMKINSIEAALATFKGIGPDQVGSTAARHIHAFECLLRAVYHTLLAEQMEAGQ